MKYAFWNGRGITALGRKKFIDDKLVPLHLDFIGFQEKKSKVLQILSLRVFWAIENLPGITSLQWLSWGYSSWC
jgi:hypothetical protein